MAKYFNYGGQKTVVNPVGKTARKEFKKGTKKMKKDIKKNVNYAKQGASYIKNRLDKAYKKWKNNNK